MQAVDMAVTGKGTGVMVAGVHTIVMMEDSIQNNIVVSTETTVVGTGDKTGKNLACRTWSGTSWSTWTVAGTGGEAADISLSVRNKR